MNTALWLVAALASLAVFVWLVVFDSPSPDEPPPTVATTTPDLYMQQAAVTQYAQDGKLRYRLDAKAIRHFEAQRVTQLEAPTLTLNRAPQSTWVASANTGTVQEAAEGKSHEELVTLRGDVRLAQQDSAQRLVLTCSELEIFPDRRFARTDQPVIITAASGRTTAAGLSGDLDSGLLKLESSAKQRVETVVLPGQIDWIEPRR